MCDKPKVLLAIAFYLQKHTHQVCTSNASFLYMGWQIL